MVAELKLLSGGAAHGLVNALSSQFEQETGLRIDGTFDAVGSMAAKLRAGGPADVVILTSGLINALTEEGHVTGGSALTIGTVATAVAVRAGDPAPGIADAAGLRTALLRADGIYFPDPQQATAGIHFAKVIRDLGIWDHVEPHLRTFPNGSTAMRELAAATSERPIGCTQVTEILNTPGVTVIGPLPPGHELATVYTAAVTARAASPDEARRLVTMLASDAAHETRRRAGFA
jgi:molybdate transport system substrate-binding protein